MTLTRFKLPVLLCVALLHGLSWSQALRDPMAPPASAALPMVGQLEKLVDTGAAPSVQIRKLGPMGKDAQGIAAEKAGPWRLVRITADSVVLQTGGNSRTIPALPVVKKKMISDAATASSTKNAKP